MIEDNKKLFYLHSVHLVGPMAFREVLGNFMERRSKVYAARCRSNAWGRHRHPTTWSYTVHNPFGMGGSNDITLRGYTFHEHLQHFSLINMNGRLYDYVLGRMLSPDNYVQSPNSSQSFNRYSYCWNNPLKYTDPSGEFVLNTILATVYTAQIDFLITGFLKGGFDPTSSAARNNAWAAFDPTMHGTKSNNAWRIDKGMLQTDPNRHWLLQTAQIILRFTWEAPQSGFGNVLSHIRNISGNVDNVDYWGGATVVNDGNDYNKSGWGLTLGSYINSQNMEASPEDPLFRHEYGHVLQSQIAGPTYLAGIGFPSLVGSALEESFGRNFHNHNYEWYETNANQLAFKYFDKYEKEALTKRPWNFDEYPIRYRPTLFWALGNPLFSPWTFIYGLTLQKP